MKTIKQRSCVPQIFLLLFVVLATALSGCQKDPSTSNEAAATNAVTPSTASAADAAPATDTAAAQRSWSEWLQGYPQGIISRTGSLLITFRKPVINADQVGKAADTNLVITPAVTGKATFDSTTSISFVPTTPFASNQSYQVSLKPEGLEGVPTDLAPAEFSFKTPALELDVKNDGLVPSTEYKNQMKLQGTIYTSDYTEDAALEKILTATVQGKALPITWEHNGTGTDHRFTINGIPRETFGTELNLVWDGSGLSAQGSQAKGQQTIAIPSQKTFNITRIRTERSTEGSKPYITITFSDLLNPSQDLTGLVQLGSDKIRTQIVGNTISVYPSDDIENGEHNLVVSAGIQAADAGLGKLPANMTEKIRLEPPSPAVRFVGRGSILPDGQNLEIPIEVQAVNAVQVTAFEIYPENIPQFLQANDIHGDSGTGRVGRYLWRKTIPVKMANPNQWNRFTLDATQLIKTKPGSLYRLELSVDRRHSAFTCPAGTPAPKIADKPLKNSEDDDSTQASGWDGISDYYQSNSEEQEFDWDKRNDPCNDSYFVNSDQVKAGQNFLASNLGLLAKQEGNGAVHVIVTDLRTATPASGVQLELRNFQGRSLVTGTTDAQGFATLTTPNTPFLLVAKQTNDTGYLRLNANSALAVSQFDVGGENVQKGLKGVLYGERGVWRPGDDIHMTFALQDRAKTLPQNHPVTVQLIDPMGKVKQVQTNKTPIGPFYTFTLKTADADPTGNWLVKANLGASTFDKTIKIETIRPNRLKVELSYGTEKLKGYENLPQATLFGQWLHGGKASNLKADVNVKLHEKTTQFGTFNDYMFDDPTRSLNSEDQQLVDGRLDAEGKLVFSKNFQPEEPAPGMLSAWFTSRVHEEGGGFSIAKQETDYYPFKNYVGIKLPKGDAERGMLLTDTQHNVEIASVDADGKPVSMGAVEVTLYKIEWKWWWDKTPESLAEYSDSSSSAKLQQSTIATTNGQGSWKFQINYPEWGRYLIRACDIEGKHCAAKTVYVDWPGWAGRAQEDGSGAAAMLKFASDKTAYQVGETAQIQLPEASVGRALLTVENSSQILDQRWIELKAGERAQIPVSITEQMAPNVYVSIALLQPHQGKTNDRPIRLYGIIPLKVDNPNTLLQPVITAAEEWKPASPQKFTVSEQAGKPMNYTLAVVDEGLLGLTRFQTPNLHESFYRKEALGIKTWDLFDDVIGAYGGQLERMLALGGGDDVQLDDAATKPKRFPPVVRFLGAFQLAANETKEHTVELPPYLGAVRIMLVAAQDQAYGKAEKPVFVRQPVMMLSSLPRTLKINETVNVPVTVFVGKPEVKQVTVQVQGDQAFTTVGAPVTVNFDGPGEKVVNVPIQAGAQPMQGKLQLRATSDAGTDVSEESVNIEIQAPNLPSIRSVVTAIEPKASWSNTITPHGLKGTNQSTLELSALPGLNLDQHLDYLVNYPHGCLEQTTSAVFPQLYLPKLLQLPEEQQKKVERHIKAGIEKMSNFQGANGNFMYWPGSSDVNDWASIYAGNFLIEAQKQGYAVPVSLLSGWQAHQVAQAQEWTPSSSKDDTSHVQAYRLYVLALAGKPQLGAMNRLRESGKANTQARWLLAAGYQQVGQPEAAAQTTQGLVATQAPMPTPDLTFSGKLGNLGIQLETLLALNKPQDAELLIQDMATELAIADNANTHDLAWALMSVSHYVSKQGQPINAVLSVDNAAATTLSTAQSLLTQRLATGDAPFKVDLRNDTDRKLYATVATKGTAPAGNEMAESNGLGISVEIQDSTKQVIWNNMLGSTKPLQLAQGQDYIVLATVVNNGPKEVKRVALSTLLPSGMEIGSTAEAAKAGLTYQDVRDDRVLSYFDLKAQERKTIRVTANAAFLGDFYFPAISSEVMYEPNKRARTAGFPVQIVKTLPPSTAKPIPSTAVPEPVPPAPKPAVTTTPAAPAATDAAETELTN